MSKPGEFNDKELCIFKLQDLIEQISKIKAKQYERFLLYINPDTHLDIDRNRIRFRDKYGSFASDDNKLKQFNNSISQIKTITHSLEIDFRDNYLKDETLQGICDLIMNNQSIQKLVLWVTSNFITDVGACKIIASISKVPNIRTLSINFDWNFEISNDTVKYLIAALKKMPNLSQLNVRLSKHTRVDDEGKQLFVTAVKELPNIKKWTWDSSAIG